MFRKVRTIVVEPNVFSCISQLARALGTQLTAKIESLLDQMFSVGLSSGLTNALRVIAMHIPTLQKNIQGLEYIKHLIVFIVELFVDGVLKMLSLILMHRPLKHPGAPKGPTPLSMCINYIDICM